MPISRRHALAFTGAFLLPQGARAQQTHAAVAVVAALYAEHIKSIDGDGKPVQANGAVWPRFFTPSLIVLWRKVNSRTPDGDQGPVDFDPFTASQDPEVKDLKLTLEASAEASATVLASFRQHGGETRVAYSLRKAKEGWRIDDVVTRIEGQRWSLRRALSGRKQ